MQYATNLQQTVRAFRSRNQLSQDALSLLLGMPKKTLEGIEYGRPFRYERMLRNALMNIEKGIGEYDIEPNSISS